jgi:hypothetical protein
MKAWKNQDLDEKIGQLALEITRLTDRQRIHTKGDVPEIGSRQGGQVGKLPHGRQDFSKFAFLLNLNGLDSIPVSGNTFTRTVIGQQVTYEILPALAMDTEYQLISESVRVHLFDLIENLKKIKSKQSDSRLIEFQDYGTEIDPINYYRREADMLIFKNQENYLAERTKINLYILRDCSCSIGEEKRKFINKISVLLMESLIAEPYLFHNIVAYSQHSTGNKKVTMHKMLLGDVRSISTPSTILQDKSSGVNYDAFALYQLITEHVPKVPALTEELVVLIGDQWPVSHGKEVKRENHDILSELKHNYPHLIICYIAVNEQYPPADLFYDYFISLKGNDSFQHFIFKFSKMIDNILENKTLDANKNPK